MARWYEVTWFRSYFEIEIYLKSGQTMKFPKGYFETFDTTRSKSGKFDSINWKCYPGVGEPLGIDIDEVVAIIGRK